MNESPIPQIIETKKPLEQRWWIWLIFLIIIVMIFGFAILAIF